GHPHPKPCARRSKKHCPASIISTWPANGSCPAAVCLLVSIPAATLSSCSASATAKSSPPALPDKLAWQDAVTRSSAFGLREASCSAPAHWRFPSPNQITWPSLSFFNKFQHCRPPGLLAKSGTLPMSLNMIQPSEIETELLAFLAGNIFSPETRLDANTDL